MDFGMQFFPDEASGNISKNDLPVVGDDRSAMKSGQKYLITGRMVSGGVSAANGNTWHFELIASPQPIQ